MATFTPPAVAKGITTKKKPSFTTDEFEQFSPVGKQRSWLSRQEQELEAQMAEQFQRNTTTKDPKQALAGAAKGDLHLVEGNSLKVTKWHMRRVNAHIQRVNENTWKTSPKATEDSQWAKFDYQLASQKATKTELKREVIRSKFQYLNDWNTQVAEDLGLLPPEATKAITTDKANHSHPSVQKARVTGATDETQGSQVSEKRELAQFLSSVVYKVLQTTPQLERELSLRTGMKTLVTHTKKVQKVTTVANDSKVSAEWQETQADKRFENLLLTPEPDSPYTPFQYQIDSSLLLMKKTLKHGSVNKNWSHELYKSNGKSVVVHYCDTFEKAHEAAKLFLKDNVIGFDMEWMSFPTLSESPKRHASLIQLANESDIALFHIAQFKRDETSLIPEPLQEIMESKDILKVGVNITGDAKRIYKYFRILPQGIFELSDLENLLNAAEVGQGRIARRLIALGRLVERYLQLPLSKGPVRISNWMNPLSSKQIRYAASDAYAGLRVFDALEKKRKELRPSPPFPACRILT